MPLVNAKCTNCGATLTVDKDKEAAICQYCNSAFIVEKAINNYHITNKNSFNANVINVYTNSNWDMRETPIEQKIDDCFSLLEQTGNHRLLSPQQLINIFNLATFESSNRSQELLIKLNNYCNDLDFKFDFSYSKNNHCSLTYKAFGCDFQSLWHDSGKVGNDGSNFEEWILYDTNLLSGKNNILQLFQKRLTNYYIELLKNGQTDVAPDNSGNGFVWKVERTSKKEFIDIKNKLSNKYLLDYFLIGINNANKLNNRSLGYVKYVFVFGKYALLEKYDTEYHCYDFKEEYSFSRSQQDIDNIIPVDRELYLSELNSLISSINQSKVLSFFNMHNSQEHKYRITSINDNGACCESLWTPKNLKINTEWKYYSTLEVKDIRELLAFFRKASGKCPDCGANYKGLFAKVCTKCGKPKKY